MSLINSLRKGVLSFVVVSASVMSISSAMAATQGDAARASDGGSVGTTAISMTVPKLVRVTGLSDIVITEAEVRDAINNATPHTELVDACVGGNGTFTYGITFTSNTGDYQLDADDGSGNSPVPYAVDWKSASTTHATGLTAQTLDRENLGTAVCATTGNLAITVADTALTAARNGTYASTLTLTVVPE